MKIFYGTKPKFTQKDKSTFSRGKYECQKLIQSKNDGLVVISKCENSKYPSWKVEYGFSCVVFNTYKEALAFCCGRFSNIEQEVN